MEELGIIFCHLLTWLRASTNIIKGRVFGLDSILQHIWAVASKSLGMFESWIIKQNLLHIKIQFKVYKNE